MNRKNSQPKGFILGGLALVLMLLSFLVTACADTPTATSQQTTQAAQTSAATTTTQSSAATTTTQSSAPEMTPEGTTTAAPNFTPVGLSAAATATPAPATVLDATLKGDLVIWESLSDKLSPLVREQNQAFSKAYPGVKITTVHYDPAEISYALEDAAKAKKLPDLVLASSDYALDFSQAKAIQPADKALDKTFLDGIMPGAQAGSTINGTQWGVAYTYSGVAVMLYNKKLVADPPKTWDDLATIVKPLYDPKDRQVGLALDVNEPFFLTALLGAYDGSLLDKQNKPTLDSPAMVSSLQFIEQLQRDKVVRNESRARDNQIEYAFRDGRLGIFITGDWDIANYAISSYGGAGSSDSADAKLDMAIAPLPKIAKTGKSLQPYNNGKSFFIGAQVSGDRLKTVKTYLSWLGRTEQQAAILDKFKLLPSSKAFLTSDAVSKNPFWSGLLAQLEQSKATPSSLEMRGVLESLRLPLQGVVAGALTPANAAKQMQQTATDNIGKLAAFKP